MLWVLGLEVLGDKDNIMANKYNFLPDFSMFDTADQNGATTEDTSSSLMTRSSKADADPAAGREEFLKSFYDNLRSSFETEDMFRKTFPPRKRPKPNQTEIEDYINKSRTKMGIDDALFEATGMYSTGTPSDDNTMTIQDASDGITVPKQPNVMVDELSSDAGSYLRNRANKGASFVGDGVQMASAGSLSVEDMDLARMLAGQTMRKEAAEMGLPVVDMEEEAKKSAVEAARERAKKGITQSKGAPQGIMSPKVVAEEEVETAEETTPVVEDKGSAREDAIAAGPVTNRDPFTFNKTDAMNFAANAFDNDTLRAAFVATVEAETGYDNRVEDNYTVDRAIAKFVTANANKDGTLGPKMTARKAALEALDQSEDNEKLGEQIFNVVYGDRSDLGNDQEGDGFKYRGRGPIQLTGKDNYKRIGEAIGVDLVKNPDLVLTNKDIGLRAVQAYFDFKGFSDVNSAAGLARVIGHADDDAQTEANRRWKKVEGLKKQFGQFSVRPSARPDTRVAAN
jgi:predicted chitinase